jgi:hypothetical protein
MKNYIALLFILTTFGLYGQRDTKRGTIHVKKEENANEANIITEDSSFGLYGGGVRVMDMNKDPEVKRFINRNLKYPENSRYKGIEDACWLSFDVNSDSTISNFKYARNITGCKECDEEASRIVNTLPKVLLRPYLNNTCQLEIPFHFLK